MNSHFQQNIHCDLCHPNYILDAKVYHLTLFEQNSCVLTAQWPTSSELKTKFDPSLDRSWCESFKIIKIHGPKNPPLGRNLGSKFSPSGWSLARKTNKDLAVQYEDCPWFNKHLLRFFDFLTHPNLSATLATDQKWPLKVIFVSLTKV